MGIVFLDIHATAAVLPRSSTSFALPTISWRRIACCANITLLDGIDAKAKNDQGVNKIFDIIYAFI